MKFFRLIVFCFIVLGFISCNKRTVEAPPDLGYNYYPAKIGSYIIYDVDSIVYRQIPVQDTQKFKFQIKEKLDTLFTDNQGRPTVKIIRYKKMYNPAVPYSQMSWDVIQDVWMANTSKTDVEVVEENIRYTKLAFPAKLNGTWDGTAHADTNGMHEYKYTEYDSPSSYGNLSFNKTLTVSQYYSSTAIMYENYYEKYARGVGMIYKEITTYNYQNGSVFTPGHIYEGLHYTMTINFYGIE